MDNVNGLQTKSLDQKVILYVLMIFIILDIFVLGFLLFYIQEIQQNFNEQVQKIQLGFNELDNQVNMILISEFPGFYGTKEK